VSAVVFAVDVQVEHCVVKRGNVGTGKDRSGCLKRLGAG
jgi:hypothetical protein